MAKLIQPSMAGGEVSAPVGARVDLSKRSVAVEEAQNFIATFTGSMMSRPGQKFVSQTKPGSSTYRFIEFEFNDTQTFVLELGETYMRFHSLGAQILDSALTGSITAATAADPVVVTSTAHGLSNGDEIYISGVAGMTELNGRNFIVANVTANTFELQTLEGTDIDGTGYTAYTSGGTWTEVYEITTPWAAADLFAIKYAQSGDVMTLCHPDYPPQELVRIDNDTWTLSEVDLTPDILGPDNITVDVNTTITAGVITGITQADPAVVTSSGHGLTTGDRVRITGVVGMAEVNNFLYEVTRLDANTFSLQYAFDDSDVDSTGFTAYSSGGVFELAIRPRSYTVTAVSSDDEEESFRGFSSRMITITNITQADPCVVTTAEGHGLEPYDDIKLTSIGGMTELNGKRFEAVFIDATSFSLKTLDGVDVDSTGFTAYTTGGDILALSFLAVSSADADWDNTISWEAVAGAEYYNVYATDTFGVFGFIGTTTKNSFEDRNLGPDYSDTVPLAYNPFESLVNGTGKYPGSTGFFGQRRWFANSNNNPNRFWASQIGHFNNLGRSIPPVATDSITASIAARRINEIKHIVPLSELIFLTSGGEFRVSGGQSGVITPTEISVSPQSYYGATDVRPIVAGDVGLFISPGEFIRDLSFQIADSKFVGKDISILARHLFDNYTISDWDYAPAPHALGFACRSDGRGLFLTYQPDQDVYAWTQATTQGKYKSTCVVREGDYDVIYVMVERKIGGITKTFLERMDERQFSDIEDGFFVDAGLTLDSPITITGITAADPVVVTAPSHGLSNGDFVDISDVLEVDSSVNEGESLSGDYNGTGFEVVNVTTNTFELQIEGTDYDGSAFAAYSSGGVARQAVTTVSGLWHLEGATVVAAANGYSNQNLTVANGSITLNNRASRVHVGLGYFTRLKTLPLSTYSEGGETSQGKAKNVQRLTVQVEKTMGMWFGPSITQMREAKFGLPSLWGQPLGMVTEDIDVTMRADWGKRKQVVIEQRDPLPLTVMTLIPDTQLGGN